MPWEKKLPGHLLDVGILLANLWIGRLGKSF